MFVAEISLVLLDLNGVLYQYDRAVRIAALSGVSGLAEAAIKAAVWDSGFEDSGDAGALDAASYLHGFGAVIGHDLSEAEWLGALQAAIAPIPAALGLLPRIPPDVACAVLTNNNLLVQKHFSTLYPEVAERVGSRSYVSAEFGARKPDPEVYRRCLARLGVEPVAALFIDDNEANVAGAIAAGLAGHHSLGHADLLTALDSRGLLD